MLSDPLLLIPLAALLCDLATGGHHLGRRLPRGAKVALAVGMLLASVGVRVTGVDEAWYELSPLPHPAPNVSHYLFREIELRGDPGAHCVGARYTDFRHVDDGVRCDVGRPEQPDVTAYGGFRNGVTSLASLYDMQLEPTLRDEMTYVSPATGIAWVCPS